MKPERTFQEFCYVYTNQLPEITRETLIWIPKGKVESKKYIWNKSNDYFTIVNMDPSLVFKLFEFIKTPNIEKMTLELKVWFTLSSHAHNDNNKMLKNAVNVVEGFTANHSRGEILLRYFRLDEPVNRLTLTFINCDI